MSEMNRKWKVAVIGCGGAGTIHATGYAKLPDVELVGFADIDLSRAEKLAGELGGKAYTSYEEMILTEKPDLVSIAMLEFDHEKPAIFAFENGCHVFSEKIMAHSIEAGQNMVAAAEKAGKRLGVNYNYRFIDSVQLLKKKLDAGEIGDIKTALFHVHGYVHHHSLDLIHYLFGGIDSLNATLTEIESERNYHWDIADELLYVPSYNEATVLRKNKTLITLISSHFSFAYPLLEIEVVGTKGRIRIKDMFFESINGEMTVQKEDVYDHIPFDKLPLSDMFHRSIASWVGTLNGLATASATGDDGLQIILLESAVSQSNREQSLVHI